jgi:hypothetical protein
VPVVGMEWVENMVRTGVVNGVGQFLVGGAVGDGMEVDGAGVEGGGGGVTADAKGKGKEVDVMMVDITNSEYWLLMWEVPMNH